jgi:hypothetical protein
MVRTFITPTKRNYNLVLELPEEYLGQELELIVFKRQEGLVTEKKIKNLSDKYRGVFSEEDAKSFNAHTQQMRKEWDNT